MIYFYLLIISSLIFYAGMRFERDRSSGVYDRRYPVDAAKPSRRLEQYQPTRKQLAAWAKERQLVPIHPSDTTIRRLVFGKRTRIDITRRN